MPRVRRPADRRRVGLGPSGAFTAPSRLVHHHRADSRSAADAGEESADSTEGPRTAPLAKHGLNWVLAGDLLAIAFFDISEPATPPTPGDDPIGFAAFIVGLEVLLALGMVHPLRDWDRIGPVPGFSRSVILFAALLVALTQALPLSRGWGVHIPSCRAVAGVEQCAGEATGREILGLLA